MSYSYQKETILNILHDTEKHYSVEEIHKELTKIIPKVSLMTVYRNLNKLVNKGVILPFHIDNVLHFCGNEEPHIHLHCVSCGTLVDKHDIEINNMLVHVKSKDFLSLLNGIVIRGFCMNCTSTKVNTTQGIT